MFRHEVEIWFSLSHPHIVRLFGANYIGKPVFVCELASNGTLVEYLRKHTDQLWHKLHEAALGVQLLHERGIIHGDLKGNNIVIGSDEKAKVTDFGLSSLIDSVVASITGAWHWVAPELLDKSATKPTRASDVYALGMCLVEAMRVVEGVKLKVDEREYPPNPWGKLANDVVKVHACKGKLPLRPTNSTDEQWRLVKRMCEHDPSDRIEMAGVVDELNTIAEAGHSKEPTVVAWSELSAAPRTIEEEITAIKQQAARIKTQEDDRGRNAVAHTFELLCVRLDLIAHQVELQIELNTTKGFQSLLREAHEAAVTAADWRDTLAGFTETSLRGFALHRRLDKFIAVHFQPSTFADTTDTHEWKAKIFSACDFDNMRS